MKKDYMKKYEFDFLEITPIERVEIVGYLQYSTRNKLLNILLNYYFIYNAFYAFKLNFNLIKNRLKFLIIDNIKSEQRNFKFFNSI
jgi:hypothetical protein